MRRVGFLLIALVIGVLAACSSTSERVSDADELKLLGFLQPDTVSREEVEGRLGPPHAAYENGRIVTYGLWKYSDRFAPASRNDSVSAPYRLVLVYRSDGTLERWSLVNRSGRR